MNFVLRDRATPEEVEAYLGWRDAYASDATRCAMYEGTRNGSRGKTYSWRADARMICRALRGLPTSARVLDVPCGGGRLSRVLTARGFRTQADDYSKFMLFESMGAASERCRSDLLQLPYRDAAFDAAVCFRFMQSAPREVRIAALAELGRVARRVVANYPNRSSVRAMRLALFGGRPLTNRLCEAEVREEVERAGLRVLGFGYKARPFFEDFVVIAERASRG